MDSKANIWLSCAVLLVSIFPVAGFASGNGAFQQKQQAPQSNINIGKLNQATQGGMADLKAVNLSKIQKQQQLKDAEKKGTSYIPPSIFSGTPLANKKETAPVKHVVQGNNNLAAEQARLRARKEAELAAAFKALKANMYKQNKSVAKPVMFSNTSSSSSSHQYSGMSGASTHKEPYTKVIAQAGKIWYATLVTTVDSYISTPVVAQIDQGPFSGARVVGQFKVAGDGNHTILDFNQMSFGNKTYQISAVAVSPNTQLPALTGSIDHHYFRRYILPAAASFLSGAANILTQPDSVETTNGTVVVNNNPFTDRKLYWSMVGKAADQFRSQIEPSGVWANPEIKIKQGTGMGILLVKSIAAE